MTCSGAWIAAFGAPRAFRRPVRRCGLHVSRGDDEIFAAPEVRLRSFGQFGES